MMPRIFNSKGKPRQKDCKVQGQFGIYSKTLSLKKKNLATYINYNTFTYKGITGLCKDG